MLVNKHTSQNLRVFSVGLKTSLIKRRRNACGGLYNAWLNAGYSGQMKFSIILAFDTPDTEDYPQTTDPTNTCVTFVDRFIILPSYIGNLFA